VRSGTDGIEGEMVTPVSDSPATSTSGGATLHVENAMARPAPLAGGTGAVYFQLHNGGDSAITLMGADTPAASAAEIHTTENDNGVMRMRQLTDGVTIGADGSIELTPGGMHLMLVGLAAPLAEGDTVKVTLHFEGVDDLTFDVPVVNMDDLPAEGEMEHDH
jgi:copper(I)-binding protein